MIYTIEFIIQQTIYLNWLYLYHTYVNTTEFVTHTEIFRVEIKASEGRLLAYQYVKSQCTQRP